MENCLLWTTSVKVTKVVIPKTGMLKMPAQNRVSQNPFLKNSYTFKRIALETVDKLPKLVKPSKVHMYCKVRSSFEQAKFSLKYSFKI